MSIDAIEYGVQAEKRVTTWYRVRCDNTSSGFIEVSKTPPTGANAMTVTIKPLYGEPFTVNADMLRRAVAFALDARPQGFDEAFRAEDWRRKRLDGVAEGHRVKVHDRGRCDFARWATVTHVDDSYVHVLLDREHEEEPEHVLSRKVPRTDIAEVYDPAEA